MIFRLKRKSLSPLSQGRVCAEWQNTLPPNLLAGGHSTSLGLCPTKLPVKRDIQLGQLDVPASSPMCARAASVILKVYLAPLVAALFMLLVVSGNVFVSRVKPSDLPAETYPTRDSSVVLETHQLYSKD